MRERGWLVRLLEPLAAHLGASSAAAAAVRCVSLGPTACELTVDEPLDAAPRPLTLVDERGATLAFEALPGETRRAEGALLQHVALTPADDDVTHRLERLLSRLRKDAHLALCLHEPVEARELSPGWDRVQLPHLALPDLDGDAVDTRTTLFGKPLALPLVIAGMTGGPTRAGELNRALAELAQRTGIALGLGSQRTMLEHPERAATFQVRDRAPDVPLLANLGAVQLNRGVTPAQCAELVEAVDADALCLHLNPLQEMIQPEGDRDFAGLAPKIRAVVEALEVPVLLKETGCGIGAAVARTAVELGCAGVDVSGAGGTSWSRVEALRQADPVRRRVGETFRDWGIPTVDAVFESRRAAPEALVIASGGVRDGLQMAKALALGADVCGMALPMLHAIDASPEAATRFVEQLEAELRVAMFCCGAGDLAALRALSARPATENGR